MTRVVTLDPLPPTVKGMFSEETHHPEFVGTSCDECNESGYVHEHDADAAMNDEVRLLCEACAP